MGNEKVTSARLRHLAALDEWLAELDREHGPVSAETLDRAEGVISRWESAPAGAPDRHPVTGAQTLTE